MGQGRARWVALAGGVLRVLRALRGGYEPEGPGGDGADHVGAGDRPRDPSGGASSRSLMGIHDLRVGGVPGLRDAGPWPISLRAVPRRPPGGVQRVSCSAPCVSGASSRQPRLRWRPRSRWWRLTRCYASLPRAGTWRCGCAVGPSSTPCGRAPRRLRRRIARRRSGRWMDRRRRRQLLIEDKRESA